MKGGIWWSKRCVVKAARLYELFLKRGGVLATRVPVLLICCAARI